MKLQKIPALFTHPPEVQVKHRTPNIELRTLKWNLTEPSEQSMFSIFRLGQLCRVVSKNFMAYGLVRDIPGYQEAYCTQRAALGNLWPYQTTSFPMAIWTDFLTILLVT